MNVETKPQKGSTVDRSVSDWYKDAVIYQVHVKAYQDASGDGIGDFAGLRQRLDHIQGLGATAIWLLPFYPSPLRDDGYDIADYTRVNPSYGTLADFKALVAEAHARGLRVITELVINHTSDQHPWFQKARTAKPGSAARDFYVWSDDPGKFSGTRIIFTDTETSNWTWDPVAGQYFWHRFFSHQPDLNFDNPRVLKEVLKVMHFWLDMGVDGLRLDAIPYLVEREGTNNENLPETHAVLKAIRADLDKHYPDRMLLAEANQWPEDTRPYFGEGDECHMGFHFPLMPRMYMAVAQEDRHPITDIIRQTPPIPDECQWAIFLRNHDELTLEMVTDKERDYLWETYAADKRARINVGIRRRLAPLMGNDRRKIELLNSLLMSLPGTPILYYGDEIGMGDNYYLGDRDGVRTPMQWSPDRNAGFSRADPQQLYLPTIQDAVYGYQSVNVEAQQNDFSSQLNWMRRIVQVRQNHSVFGRGAMRLLYPLNRKVLAYLREDGGETVLCVANLSRSAQAAEIDLAEFRGRVPIELTGQAAFPPVGDLPYLMTLPGHGFYWFLLADEAQAPRWHRPMTQILPEFVTLTTRDGRLGTALTDPKGREMLADQLPRFLELQRWFAAKDQKIRRIDTKILAELGAGAHALTVIDVDLGGQTQRYFLPLSALWGEENVNFGAPKLAFTLAKLRRGPKVGALIDGTADEAMAEALWQALCDDTTVDTADGTVAFHGTDALRAIEDRGSPRLLSIEQSNASIAFGNSVILKIYRHLRTGIQPDIEVSRFLTDVGFGNTPAYLGSAEYLGQGADPTPLAAAFAFVQNQGDAWGYLSDNIDRDLQEQDLAAPDTEPAEPSPNSLPLILCASLGERTAGLHRALATDTDDPAFATRPISEQDVAGWVADVKTEVTRTLDALTPALAGLPDGHSDLARRVLDRRSDILHRLDATARMAPSGLMTRIHGDYHLGQVLVVQNDVMIIDFEGEPRRPLDERREKTSPLRDVAGMLRSLDYVGRAAIRRRADAGGDTTVAEARIAAWSRALNRTFMDNYLATVADSPLWPGDEAFARALLDLFLIQKAAYEIAYEAASRPAWLDIPLSGLLSLIEDETAT